MELVEGDCEGEEVMVRGECVFAAEEEETK